MDPVLAVDRATRFRPRDPRTAFFAASVAVVASLATVRDAGAMLAVLAFVCAWHMVVAPSVRSTARSLARVVPFALVIVVLNAVLVPGDSLVSVAGRRVASRAGFDDGIFFALRLAVMLMAVSALLATAAPESMARGAYDAWRRVSRGGAGRLALFVFLSMGFVPLAADEFARIRTAQSLRGGGFAGGLPARAEMARAWLVPFLVAAVHRSGEMAKAVELRSIRERLVLAIEAPSLRIPDVALAAGALAVAVLAST